MSILRVSWLSVPSFLVLLVACGADMDDPAAARYRSERYDFAFTYPARLHLHEKTGDFAPLLSLALVEDTPAHRDILAGRPSELTEAPPMITVDVYANPDGLDPADWVAAHSNWILADKQPEMRRIVDLDYLIYHWDGLYAGQSAIHATPPWMYVFSVSWITPEDPLRADYDTLLETVRIGGADDESR